MPADPTLAKIRKITCPERVGLTASGKAVPSHFAAVYQPILALDKPENMPDYPPYIALK